MFKANSTQTWFDSPTSTQNSITGKASSYAEGSQSSETQILNLKSYVRALQPHPFSLSWDLPYSFHANKKKTLGSTPLYHVYHRLKTKNNIMVGYPFSSWQKEKNMPTLLQVKKDLSLCFLYPLDKLHLGAQLLLYRILKPGRYPNKEKKMVRVFEPHGFLR